MTEDGGNIVSAENSGRFVVYASRHAKLDSDVIRGGGTDDTEAIQAILDRAPEWGGLHLVMDGAALVKGLEVYSNTTIECENKDCGFYLASGANRSILQNAHPDFKIRHDRNIALIGGTYNHNCAGQLHHVMEESGPEGAFGNEKWTIAMEFYGVEGLILRDVTIRNQRTFAVLAANWYRVTMENITIELPDNMYGQNQDGIHFWGPGRYLSMKNICGGSGDDFIALAPDENDSVSDITDVLIDGVFLDNADQGIRMLSRGAGRLDRVTVRNVTGTYKSFGFYINPWFPGKGGNYGNITIENADMRQTTHKYDYTNPFLFRIGGNIETLTLRNVHCHNPGDVRCIAEIGIPFYTPGDDCITEVSHIGVLMPDGLQIYEKDACAGDNRFFRVLCPVDSLIMRNTHIERNVSKPADDCLIETSEHAHIGRLHISGMAVKGINALIAHHAGDIDVLCFHDILCTGSVQSLVKGGGRIGELYADAVFGAKVGRET